MKQFLLVLILTISALCSYSDDVTIKGKVLDYSKKIAVSYLNVAFFGNDSTYIGGTTTDSLGNFRYTIKDGRQLIVSLTHISYTKKAFSIDLRRRPSCDTLLYMNGRNESLDFVTVTGKMRQIRNTANSIEYTLTSNDRKEALLASNIFEKIPSVYVDYSNNIYVNGSANVLILKNGIELPSNSLVNQIPPKSIKKISLSTSIPPKYASKNYSAIVNVVTDETNISKNISIDYKSSFKNTFYDLNPNVYIANGHSTYILYYKYYFRNISSKLTVQQQYSDARLADTSTMEIFPRKEIDNEGYLGYTYSKSKNLTFGLDSYLSMYREYFSTKDCLAGGKPFSYYNEKYHTSSSRGYFQYLHHKVDLSGLASYTWKEVKDLSSYYDTESTDQITQEYKKVQSNIDFSYAHSDKWSVSAGADYSGIDITYNTHSESGTNGYTENRLSTYTDVTRSSDFLTVSLGTNLYSYWRSYSYSTGINSTKFLPKVSVMVNLTPKSMLKAGYYSYTDNPTIWQLFPSPKQITSNVVTTGNLLLKPTITSSLYLSHAYNKGILYLNNEVYYSRVKNKIEDATVNNGSTTTIQSINLDNMYTLGIKTSVSIDITPWYKIKLFNDVYRKEISSNTYVCDNLYTFKSSIQNNFTVSKQIFIACRYEYNSQSLLYNGKFKPLNSSIIQLRYKPTDFMSVSLIAVQPVGKYQTTSYSYSEKTALVREETFRSKLLLISMTLNLFKEKVTNNSKEIYDEDKKH